MHMKNNRNGNIELLRFLFANCIVLHHSFLKFMKGGWIGVEFFFIITGFFLCKKLSASADESSRESLKVTADAGVLELKKRFFKIFPFFLLSTIFGFIIKCLALDFGTGLKGIVIQAFTLPYDFLFLQNYGYGAPSCTGVVWYLSAMFFAIWIIYPFIRRYWTFFSKYAAPVLAVFITGYLVRTYGMMGSANDWSGVNLNSGFLRAYADISWGCFLYQCSLSSAKYRKNNFAIISGLLEIACYFTVFAYMFVWNPDIGAFDPLAVTALSLGIVLTLSDRSFLSGIFDNRISYALGNFSMVLFMNHAYWTFNIEKISSAYSINLSVPELKASAIILSYLSAFLVLIIVDFIKKAAAGKRKAS
jgi:peptidoglycan/LPS O-acetylase OafA/YrhL